MDKRVAWSPEAVEDTEAIAEYISRDSKFYAEAVVTKFLSTAGALPDFPHAGRVVPELGDECIRVRFGYSYRVIYRVDSGRILVVAVIHGQRLLEALTERFSGRGP